MGGVCVSKSESKNNKKNNKSNITSETKQTQPTTNINNRNTAPSTNNQNHIQTPLNNAERTQSNLPYHGEPTSNMNCNRPEIRETNIDINIRTPIQGSNPNNIHNNINSIQTEANYHSRNNPQNENPPQGDNHSINEEFTSRRNQLSITNPLNLYPSSNGVVFRNVIDGSIEQSQVCSLCSRSFWSNLEYHQHLPWCSGNRSSQMHHSINEILNLVHTLNRQLQSEAPLNLLNLLGMEDPEESCDYFDWTYTLSADGTAIWKNNGKVKLSKDELNKITTKNSNKIKDEKYFVKRIWMNKLINKNYYDKSGTNTTLVVSRDNILEESFNQFMTTRELDLKKAMHIFFVDEVAHDVGGVYREWYTNLFDEIFKKERGFFYEITDSGPGKGTCFIPTTSPKDHKQNYKDYYEFFGKVLGKAIFDKITIKANFNYVLLKQLLRFDLCIGDLKSVESGYYSSLENLIDNKIPVDSGLFFTWNVRRDDGSLEEVELLPNGRNIMITEENKLQFVSRVVDFVCYESIKEKVDALVKGFYSIMKQDLIRIFTVEEFDFLLSGQSSIDLRDWKANTIYKGVYSESHKTIQIFWSVLTKLPADHLLRFYKFCTGCNRVPVDGFSSLQGTRNKYQKFCIESPSLSDENHKGRLIEANTCFNRIYLPQYDTEETMRKVISTIVENDTNFFGKQ